MNSLAQSIAILAEAATEPAPAADPETLVAIAAVLVLLAMGLFFMEVFFPSMGLITIMGLACIGGALVIAFGVSTTVGVVFLVASALAIPAVVYAAVKLLPRSGLVLEPDEPEAAKPPVEGAPMPGDRGVATSILRPSGTAVFAGRRHSVITSGEMVEVNTEVEVVRTEGARTVVRAVRS